MGIGNDLIGDLERLTTAQVLSRQEVFRMTGPTSQCWRAEKELEEMYPGTRCLLLPSATVALSLLLEVIGLAPGQNVLITPFGWLSNWSCLQRAGLVPRFLPLNDDLQLEVERVLERIDDRTGAVIVPHLLGRGQQDIERIAILCADRGIALLEDIAQSFGVSVRGKRTGTFGIGAWCSLNHHKLLSTGDGGFAIVTDQDVFLRLSARHDHGCMIDDGKRRPAPVVQPGLSLRVTELTGAVLRAQLARYHFVRNQILILHRAITDGLGQRFQLEFISPHDGDIPFTVLFRRPERMRYQSLLESGWHVAGNVPWLKDKFAAAAKVDKALASTIETLQATSAVGAGFVDPYYAVPLGLSITDSLDDVPQLIDLLSKHA